MQAFSTLYHWSKLLLCSVLILLNIIPNSAYAEIDNLTFSGFYTLDVTYAESDIDLVGLARPSLNTDSSGFRLNNSLFGAKVSYQFNDDLSFSVLGDMAINAQDEFVSNLTWGYLSYDMGDDRTVRAGKFQMPLLQGTELRTIGLTRIWARPIIPGNGASGFTDFTGLDVIQNKSYDGHHFTFQAALGAAEHEQDSINGKSVALGTVKYQYEDFWLRSALIHINYELFSRDGQPINTDANINLFSLESEWTLANFVVNAGYSTGRADDSPDDSIGYLSINYPIDSFTPYVYISQKQQDVKPLPVADQGNNGPNTGMVPPPAGSGQQPPTRPPIAPQQPPQTEMEMQRLPNDFVDDVWALGMRWDWDETLVFKAQFEQVLRKESTFEGNRLGNNTGNAFSFTVEGWF